MTEVDNLIDINTLGLVKWYILVNATIATATYIYPCNIGISIDVVRPEKWCGVKLKWLLVILGLFCHIVG